MTLSVLLLAIMLQSNWPHNCAEAKAMYPHDDCTEFSDAMTLKGPDHEQFYNWASGSVVPQAMYDELMCGRIISTGRGEITFCFPTKYGSMCVPYEAKIPVPKELQ